MAADNGDWIKLYRKTLDSCVASDDWLCRLWVQLLLRANWKPSWFAGTQIEVGQLAFSQGNLAAELKVHRSTLIRGLKKLSDLGQIKVSNANNRFSVVTICNWETYQNGKQAGGTTDATTAATTGEQLANNCATTAATHPKKERNIRREEGKNYSDVFLEFWRVFPSGRKKSKADAFKAFEKATATVDPQAIIAAATEYAASDEGKGQFVKMPSTWLNQGCWDDDREAWKEKGIEMFSPTPKNTSKKTYTPW